jgi:hypothetical protein
MANPFVPFGLDARLAVSRLRAHHGIGVAKNDNRTLEFYERSKADARR